MYNLDVGFIKLRQEHEYVNCWFERPGEKPVLVASVMVAVMRDDPGFWTAFQTMALDVMRREAVSRGLPAPRVVAVKP